MKVLLFNGSIHQNGNTATALAEIAKQLNSEGIETEILSVGAKPIRDCIACGGCVGKGKCVFDDDVANEWLEKAKNADGFVFGSPVYYAHASGRLLSIMDRMFYAGKSVFKQKVGASVAVARRAGTTSALDDINKHLLISGMFVVGSSYWNVAFGRSAGECTGDGEGMQTMQNLAKNMAWALKCFDLGKKSNIMPPELPESIKTHFIR